MYLHAGCGSPMLVMNQPVFHLVSELPTQNRRTRRTWEVHSTTHPATEVEEGFPFYRTMPKYRSNYICINIFCVINRDLCVNELRGGLVELYVDNART